jgi:hypothetical protein
VISDDQIVDKDGGSSEGQIALTRAYHKKKGEIWALFLQKDMEAFTWWKLEG